jgi:hypothetical protein
MVYHDPFVPSFREVKCAILRKHKCLLSTVGRGHIIGLSGRILNKAACAHKSQVRTGKYIVQERICVECNKKQLRREIAAVGYSE